MELVRKEEELNVFVMERYLSIPTHGAVDGRPFLGLAEERIVWMAAPQLLAWVKRAVLWDTERGGASEGSPEKKKKKSKEETPVDTIQPSRDSCV